MFKFLCVLVLTLNILGVFSYPKHDWKEDHHHHHKPKGRHWEYSTKIEHPAPKHGYHHKGNHFHSDYHGKDLGKGWTHVSDTGDQNHGVGGHGHYDAPIHFEKPIHLEKPIHFDKPEIHIPHIPIHIPPVHTIPIHIPKYNDISHEYQPQHYEPPKHYESPKHYHQEEHKKDSLDKLTDFNVDGIIDDIQKDLSKNSNNYVS